MKRFASMIRSDSADGGGEFTVVLHTSHGMDSNSVVERRCDHAEHEHGPRDASYADPAARIAVISLSAEASKGEHTPVRIPSHAYEIARESAARRAAQRVEGKLSGEQRPEQFANDVWQRTTNRTGRPPPRR